MPPLQDTPPSAPPAPTPGRPRARRGAAVVAMGLAVFALHLVVVSEVSGHTARAPAQAAPPSELRRLVLAPLPAVAPAAEPPQAPATAEADAAPQDNAGPASPPPSPPLRATPRPAPPETATPTAEPPPAAAEPAAPDAAPPGSEAMPTPTVLALAPAADTGMTTAQATAPAAAPAPVSASEPAALPRTPTYAVAPPRAAVLRYRLQRGLLSGEGSLQWRPQGSRYELTLEARVLGFEVLQQRSSGGFDTAGLAPVRFTDRRKGRDLQAANFQRDKGLVSFSGPSTQWPLPSGAQDRISWLVQLAAIANARSAEPLKPGERIVMPVFGARGDASIWTFVVVGNESLALQGEGLPSRLSALRLRRQPDRPHDTHADAWLDPARQHLPVKVEIGNEGSDPLQLLLIGESAP